MSEEERQMENNWEAHAAKVAPQHRQLAAQSSVGSVCSVILLQLCSQPRYPKALVGGKEQLWSCIDLCFLLQAEVEETLKRIQSQKGVQGIIVVNSEGIPIKSTIDNSTTIQYAGLMHSFIMKARSTVRDIDPQNDLTFLRIRSKKNEIMVAPDKDYFLIVIQNPTE